MLKCAGLDVSDFFNDASKSIRLVEVCVMQKINSFLLPEVHLMATKT